MNPPFFLLILLMPKAAPARSFVSWLSQVQTLASFQEQDDDGPLAQAPRGLQRHGREDRRPSNCLRLQGEGRPPRLWVRRPCRQSRIQVPYLVLVLNWFDLVYTLYVFCFFCSIRSLICWIWCREAGEPSKKKSYLPADKQYHITGNGIDQNSNSKISPSV